VIAGLVWSKTSGIDFKDFWSIIPEELFSSG